MIYNSGDVLHLERVPQYAVFVHQSLRRVTVFSMTAEDAYNQQERTPSRRTRSTSPTNISVAIKELAAILVLRGRRRACTLPGNNSEKVIFVHRVLSQSGGE